MEETREPSGGRMAYNHVEVEWRQAAKRSGMPCGDAVLCRRSVYHTTLICADGIGSGVKAHVASQMNVARLAELLDGGYSLRDAFMSAAGTMSRWRDHSMPFSAFILVRILNEGMTTVLAYEMPPPIWLGRAGVQAMSPEPLVVDAGVANEYHGRLSPGEGLLVVSDGIIQAGLGRSDLVHGWGVDGLESFLAFCMENINYRKDIVGNVLDKAQEYDGVVNGDDKTVAVAWCRAGQVVDVLTGPPADRSRDGQVVENFLAKESLKVICGATTADIVARYVDRDLTVEQRPASWSTPPRYFMEGIDLVTEGAVTLNQVYNIIDQDLKKNHDRSAAADLACLLQEADFIRFVVGMADNPVAQDLVYRKQGILRRAQIVPLIAGKLELLGKLVDICYV